MKKDDPVRPPDESVADTEAWLDGLAGRPGQGAAHEEGVLWREALQATDDDAETGQKQPSWQAVVEAAQQRVDGERRGTGIRTSMRQRHLTQHPPTGRDAAARRIPRPSMAWAAASALLLVPLLVGGIWLLLDPQDDAVRLRGLMPGGAVPPADEWRSERPEEAAQAMAIRLKAAGAKVVLVPAAPGMELRVQADGPNVEAVQAELMAIDAGLDAQGRATVKILPLPVGR